MEWLNKRRHERTLREPCVPRYPVWMAALRIELVSKGSSGVQELARSAIDTNTGYQPLEVTPVVRRHAVLSDELTGSRAGTGFVR